MHRWILIDDRTRLDQATPISSEANAGLNNKIRVIQRRAYGLRDEEYLRLIILTSVPPKI